MDLLLEQLKGELADDSKRLGLSTLIGKLEAAQDGFKSALVKPRPGRTTFDQVRAAREEAREGLARLQALIVGKYRKAADAETRNALLAPILEQNARVADSYRRRRGIADVDPDTGEETGQSDASPAPAPGAAEA